MNIDYGASFISLLLLLGIVACIIWLISAMVRRRR